VSFDGGSVHLGGTLGAYVRLCARTFAVKTLQNKGRRHLLSLQEQFEQQCHGKHFHVWRWEKAFHGHFCPDWIRKKLDQETWKNEMMSLLTGRRAFYYKQNRITRK